MRKLNYLVLGFTPMFTAVAFAQVLNTGIKERMIVQAQADGRSETRSPMGTGGNDRVDENKSKDMTSDMNKDKHKDKHKGGYGMRSRSGKQDTPQDFSSQARKGKTDEGSRPAGE